MSAQRSRSLLGGRSLSLLVSLLLVAAFGPGQALANQMAGMPYATTPVERTAKAVALGVKQLISLPADMINARFGLPDKSHGLAVTVAGDVSMGATLIVRAMTAGRQMSAAVHRFLASPMSGT